MSKAGFNNRAGLLLRSVLPKSTSEVADATVECGGRCDFVSLATYNLIRGLANAAAAAACFKMWSLL